MLQLISEIIQAEVEMEEQRKSKQILFIIALYFFITITSHYTTNRDIGHSLKNILQNPDMPAPNVKHLLSIFKNQKYEGIWEPDPQKENSVLTKSKGRLGLQFTRYGNNEKTKYDFILRLNNGEYIDDGVVTLNFRIHPEQWQSTRNNSEIVLTQKMNKSGASADQNQKKIKVSYQYDIILKNMEQYILEAEELKIIYKYDEAKNAMKVGIQIDSQQLSVTMAVARQETKLLSTITFALVLFFISYMEFSAIMSILRGIIEGQSQPINFSIISVLGAMMWDAALCLVAFIEAFKNQENLILFIMPAFLLCLLFTNLELRFILFIFQANSEDTNERSIICKFNLLSYGALFMLYPILYLMNFSSYFFLIISLIFLPQIYTNGVNSQRPEINSPYYKKFLFVRFSSILYLKCFPWNIFELEPDYALGFGCISLLCLQILILRWQKIYGPRRILPRFIMPPSYDYKYELTKQQQDEDCSICISPLHQKSNPAVFSFNQPYKLMKTPCGHKYHGSCLSQWMQIKKQCPQCRKKLPPYQ